MWTAWIVPALLAALVAAQPAGAVEVIVDDADAPLLQVEGPAKSTRDRRKEEDQQRSPSHGGSWLTLGAWGKPNHDGARVTVSADLPAAGLYEVYLRWNTNPAMPHGLSDAVPTTILHRGGRDTLQVVEEAKDGFLPDSGFVFHGVPQSGGYGINLIRSFAQVTELLDGSPWQINDPNRANLYLWAREGLAPLMYRGNEFSRTIGRAWAMKRAQNNVPGYGITETIATLIPTAPPEDRALFEGMVKAWLTEDHYGNAYTFDNFRVTVPTLLTFKRVRQDEAIKPWARPSRAKVFHYMDFVAYHRPGSAAELSMSSSRIQTHECLHGVNARGWYQGEGMLLIHTPDATKYNDDFRPTVDPYRMPGTTVDKRPREEGVDGAKSTSHWAGGAQLADAAAAGMILATPGSTLTARKSWFMVGDQIVCLGSGIRGGDGQPVETIVDNIKVPADASAVLTVNGTPRADELGAAAAVESAQWAHLTSPVAGADMAWVFLQPTTLQTLREDRTHAWSELAKKEDPTPITRRFVTLWLDHGTNPDGATYQYAILPGASVDQAERYAAAPPAAVLACTEQVHAVRVPGEGVTAANFWAAGAPAVQGLSCSGAASVIVRVTDSAVTLGVADPTFKATGAVEVTLDAAAARAVETDPAVEVLSLSPLKVRVDLTDTRGRTLSASFAR